MVKFEYVEEYLEVISGHRDPITGKPINTWFYDFKPIINLARYDVKVLESMTTTVTQQHALTHRQGELACKIILNYRRQLANKLIDVTPVETPKWRTPLREMDYTQSIFVENDTIKIRFPYNNDLINSIREFGKTSQGKCHWNIDLKIWEADLTEYNLSWLVTWAELNKFEIDSSAKQLVDLIQTTEQESYAIELYVNNGKLDISNCPDSLRDYIDQHIGGLVSENLLQLIDMSSILGYTVSSDISNVVSSEFTPRFYNLIASRELKINPNTLMVDSDFDSVLDYADAMQRWPVVLYEPDMSNRMLTKLQDRYGEDYDTERYIHTTRPVLTMSCIPLLISSAGMVFGGDKQLMIQRSEKIVYTATEVYNRKTKKVEKIAG